MCDIPWPPLDVPSYPLEAGLVYDRRRNHLSHELLDGVLEIASVKGQLVEQSSTTLVHLQVALAQEVRLRLLPPLPLIPFWKQPAPQ